MLYTMPGACVGSLLVYTASPEAAVLFPNPPAAIKFSGDIL